MGLDSVIPVSSIVYSFTLLFLPYLSSAFVPVETMPSWLQPLATHQPMGPLVESLRALLVGGGEAKVLVSLIWRVGIILVATALTVLAFRRSGDRWDRARRP